MLTHLRGGTCIGVSPQGEDGLVRWACFDVDSLDSKDLVRTTGALGAPYLVEHTGGRGRHVWRFFTEPVPADDVIAWGQNLLERIGPPVEFYPKPGGNIIRLPGGRHGRTGERSRVEFGTSSPAPFNFVRPETLATPNAGVAGKGNGEPTRSQAIFAGDTAQFGGRNNGLYWLRTYCEHLGMPEELRDMVVTWVNDNQFASPLSHDELSRTILRSLS